MGRFFVYFTIFFEEATLHDFRKDLSIIVIYHDDVAAFI